MSTLFKIVYVNPDTGELGRLPDLGLVNIGGTLGPTFTVGGKGLLFTDGTSSDGSAGGNQLYTNLQLSYGASASPAQINLVTGKDFVINALNNNGFSINADTGLVSISNLQVTQINGINLIATLNALQTSVTNNSTAIAVAQAEITDHLDGVGIKHAASEISVAGPFSKITGADLEEALVSIDAQLGIANGPGHVLTYEYLHPVPAEVWTVVHAHNSVRQTITVYGTDNVQVWADDIRIIDANTAQISFSSPQSGRALILSF